MSDLTMGAIGTGLLAYYIALNLKNTYFSLKLVAQGSNSYVNGFCLRLFVYLVLTVA